MNIDAKRLSRRYRKNNLGYLRRDSGAFVTPDLVTAVALLSGLQGF